MRDFLYRFFQGRYGAYGTDRMTRFLLVFAAVLLVLSFLTPFVFLYYVAFAILFYCYFRMLSRNVPARYRENEAFVKFTDKIAESIKGIGTNSGNNKSFHIYKCPKCGQRIRIPKGKEKVDIRCPICGTEFSKRA